MCGISGVISQKKIKVDSFFKMNQVINHRGPDDEGFVFFKEHDIIVAGSNQTSIDSWQSSENYSPTYNIKEIKDDDFILAFGHRRLSILDLSPKGHQPLCDDTGRYWITYNGEIYNYLELRDELEKLGFQFNTTTDTEVILVAFKAWGIDCQNKFNGMWSFAIFDSKEKKIFLSRDRFGIKPFYYWFDFFGNFFFASEIKQFTVLDGWKSLLNKNRAYDYLYYSLTDHTEETLFKNVFCLPPGHCFYGNLDDVLIQKSKKRLSVVNWYVSSEIAFKGTFNEAKDIFLDRFKEAIKLHLRADVSVGSALSGGLDSSSIVSCINVFLKDQGKSELQKTFSSCSLDEKYDEKKWIDEVVKATGVDSYFVYPDGKDVFSLTEKIVWHMDEPYQSQSVFLGYHVFKKARENNVIVLLNGQGADEYLSGYSDFKILRQKKLFKKLKFKQLFKELNSFSELSTIVKGIVIELLPRSIIFALSTRTNHHKKLDRIIEIKQLVKKKKHPYSNKKYSKSDPVEISKYQLFNDPLQRYLKWEDRNSMAHSVEARVPFLDYRLVEFSQSLPLEFLDAPAKTKKILVESMEGILNEKVRQRKDKKGFITPEQRWLISDYPEEFINLIESTAKYSMGIIKKEEAVKYIRSMQRGEIEFDYSYWRIIQFCIWMKVFNVQVEN